MSLSERPLAVSSVASRCLCDKCGRQPQVRAEGTDPIVLTAACHGETESRTVNRSELVFTQRFFVEDDGGDAGSTR